MDALPRSDSGPGSSSAGSSSTGAGSTAASSATAGSANAGSGAAARALPAPPFHLAIPVADLAATRRFYGELLGCAEGRSAERWIDYDFFGHQLSAHLRPEEVARAQANPAHTNVVDGDDVPVRHFGAVLPWTEWEALGARLREAGAPFLIEPRVRFAGEVGEQGTFFLLDPSGNALEFKSFRDPARLFAR